MATVRFAANFQRNLEQLEAFEQQRESPAAFGTLLDELFDGIVPAIERFPQSGSDLLPGHRDPLKAPCSMNEYPS